MGIGAEEVPGMRRREGRQSANELRNAAGQVCLREAKAPSPSCSASWAWQHEPHLPGLAHENSKTRALKNRSSAIMAASVVKDGRTAQMKWLSMACGLAQYMKTTPL